MRFRDRSCGAEAEVFGLVSGRDAFYVLCVMKLLFRSISAAALAISASLLVACAATSSTSPPADGPAQGCTEEAKVCPDGSAVARTGPNCEFAPCPAAVKACTEEAKVCPDGSSVGRTGPNCEFAPCPGSDSAAGGTGGGGCKNECGNGTCEEVVCQALGCPCSESKQSCPQDCK